MFMNTPNLYAINKKYMNTPCLPNLYVKKYTVFMNTPCFIHAPNLYVILFAN